MPDLRLRPMTQPELRDYLRWSIDEYADEIHRNAGIARAEAGKHAERTFEDLLPGGLATARHRLLIAEDAGSGERVGLLWLAVQRRAVDALWIYDIVVDEPRRGQGYGRRLMELVEDQARELGVGRIELNVFGDNERARRLYASMGYVEISRQMYKALDPPA